MQGASGGRAGGWHGGGSGASMGDGSGTGRGSGAWQGAPGDRHLSLVICEVALRVPSLGDQKCGDPMLMLLPLTTFLKSRLRLFLSYFFLFYAANTYSSNFKNVVLYRMKIRLKACSYFWAGVEVM